MLCPAAGSLTRGARGTTARRSSSHRTTPAFVVGPATDVLAGNGAWRHLVEPLGMLESTEPNLARYMFLHRELRERSTPTGRRRPTIRWVACTPPPLAGVTTNASPQLIDELREAPDFVERWSKFASNRRAAVPRGYCILISGASASTTRCSFSPMKSTSNGSPPGSQPTMPPPMLSQAWATRLVHRVPHSCVS